MKLFTKLIPSSLFTLLLLSLFDLVSAQTTVTISGALGNISGQATSTTNGGLTFTINSPNSLGFQSWYFTNYYPAGVTAYMAIGTVATGNNGPGGYFNTNNAQGTMLFLGCNQDGFGIGAHGHNNAGDWGTGAMDYRVAKSDASAFKINSMYIDADVYGNVDQNYTLVPITITGYKSGSPVASTNVAGIDFLTSGSTSYATGNNALNYTVGSGLTGAGTITFTGSNWQNIDEIRFTTTSYPCVFGINSIVYAAAIIPTPTWNGTTWINGTPTSSTDAIVTDVSNTAPSSFSCKNLTINSGASLNTTGISATVNGNITNSGNGFSGLGTVTIAAASTLSGNAITINGKLNLSSGTFTTGGLLKIGPGGAIIGTLSNISGSVTLQQSIIAQRGWRMFANPFTTTQTFASLSTNNNVTIQTTGSSNVAGIADTRTWSNSGNAWADAGTSTAANTPYGLFIRGIKTDISGGGTGTTYTAGPTAFTYSVSGTINTSDFVVSAPSNAANFSIIGNPFAAPVNSSELTNGTGVPYYVYQISVSGNGRTKSGGWSSVLSSSATTPIPVFGAIAWKPSTSYTIHTSGINTSNAPATGLFGVEPALQYAELQVEQSGNYQDKYYVRLDAGASENGTDKNDLEKFYNDNVNVYSITTDKSRLAIDARNILKSIPLGISALAGDYNFKLANNSLPEGTTVTLNDKYLNTQTELKAGDVYLFSITSDAATKGEQRFELLFSSKKTISAVEQNGSLTAEVLGNITSSNQIAVRIGGANTPVTISIKDLNGIALGILKTSNGIQYVNVGNASKGMLLLQISDGKSSIIKKVMKL